MSPLTATELPNQSSAAGSIGGQFPDLPPVVQRLRRSVQRHKRRRYLGPTDESLIHSTDHHRVPADGHGIAKPIICRRILGGQLLHLSPVVQRLRHCVQRYRRRRYLGWPNPYPTKLTDHHRVPADGHGKAKTIIGRRPSGSQLLHLSPIAGPSGIPLKDIGGSGT